MALPIPRDAPVIKTTFPSTNFISYGFTARKYNKKAKYRRFIGIYAQI
jgi:hypothetical protein